MNLWVEPDTIRAKKFPAAQEPEETCATGSPDEDIAEI